MSNFILKTDSYKLGHWRQYPNDTEYVYSYFESRSGADYDQTVFFGLTPILAKLAGQVVTQEDVEHAYDLAAIHFGDPNIFNRKGWEYIVNEHGGRLPIRIKAVPEGTVVPSGNVMMTVENTDPKCFWLTNALESLLTHVWYPSTVASKSRAIKKDVEHYLDATSDNPDAIDFMLHDFGYRGATTDEAAAIGGAGHLVNFSGTDTLVALELVQQYYGAGVAGFSVPATEHSVMTSLGRDGEFDVVEQLFDEHPTGILSIVSDSYDVYNFVKTLSRRYREHILARDGKVVFRPDSKTERHPLPADQVVWILDTLWDSFGGTTNSKGYKVLDPHVGVLWGDGIDHGGILAILSAMRRAGYSAENIVNGMGGGLLQKLDRDTQRFAFKSSAQCRNGEWYDVQKDPLDASKKSKAGRLRLNRVYNETTSEPQYVTRRLDDTFRSSIDILQTVFWNGTVFNAPSWDDIRSRAAA